MAVTFSLTPGAEASLLSAARLENPGGQWWEEGPTPYRSGCPGPGLANGSLTVTLSEVVFPQGHFRHLCGVLVNDTNWGNSC